MSYTADEKRTHRARRNIGLDHLKHLSSEEERQLVEAEKRRLKQKERGREW